ncbi:hypothetical protein HK101_011279, partial [Irineochytrium annulatum]
MRRGGGAIRVIVTSSRSTLNPILSIDDISAKWFADRGRAPKLAVLPTLLILNLSPDCLKIPPATAVPTTAARRFWMARLTRHATATPTTARAVATPMMMRGSWDGGAVEAAEAEDERAGGGDEAMVGSGAAGMMNMKEVTVETVGMAAGAEFPFVVPVEAVDADVACKEVAFEEDVDDGGELAGGCGWTVGVAFVVADARGVALALSMAKSSVVDAGSAPNCLRRIMAGA